MEFFKKEIKSTMPFISLLAFIILLSTISLKAEAALDTTPPVITLVGPSTITVAFGSAYAEPGATAIDDVDGDLTAKIVKSIHLPSEILGPFTVTYNVIDSSGNHAEEVTRTVEVSFAEVSKELISPTIPVATPPAGSYAASQLVSLSSTDKGGSGLDNIYYTTDGTIPNKTSTIYAAPITVDKDMTIKAVAYDKAGNRSSVLQAIYTITAGTSSADTEEEDDDSDDEHDDNHHKSNSGSSTQNLAVTAVGNNKNIAGGNEEMGTENETEGQVQGEETALQASQENQNNSREKVVGAETSKNNTSSGWVWWRALLLLILLLAATIFWVRKMKQA